MRDLSLGFKTLTELKNNKWVKFFLEALRYCFEQNSKAWQANIKGKPRKARLSGAVPGFEHAFSYRLCERSVHAD
jgi:hypothetical protein